jgi:hypothetical protein
MYQVSHTFGESATVELESEWGQLETEKDESQCQCKSDCGRANTTIHRVCCPFASCRTVVSSAQQAINRDEKVQEEEKSRHTKDESKYHAEHVKAFKHSQSPKVVQGFCVTLLHLP